MTNLESKLKSRDIFLPKKVLIVKAMVFPVVIYRCESWTIKMAECWRIDVFKLWCWRTLLRVPWSARRSNQSILKEIYSEYSLEGLMLKLQYSEAPILWPPDVKSRLIAKDPDAGKDWGQEEKGCDREWDGWVSSGDQSIGASASAQSFQWIFRVDFPQDWLVWSPCCPRDLAESSPAPQF